MINMFLDWLKRRGSWRMIQRNGSDYLERYFLLRVGRRNVYLHRVWQNDPDDPHTHPWWSCSIIVKGGYTESFLGGATFLRKRGDIVFRDPNSFHRLSLPEGAAPGSTWTIFITGSRKKSWGFMTKDGYQDAGEYSREDVAIHGLDFVLKGVLFPRIIWLTDKR